MAFYDIVQVAVSAISSVFCAYLFTWLLNEKSKKDIEKSVAAIANKDKEYGPNQKSYPPYCCFTNDEIKAMAAEDDSRSNP